jgi:hypothetical protein
MYQHALAVRSAMSGPFLAPRVFGGAAEESMRLAFFKGRLELIGWRPSPQAERLAAAKRVARPSGAKRWREPTRRRTEHKRRPRKRLAGMSSASGSSSPDNRVPIRRSPCAAPGCWHAPNHMPVGSCWQKANCWDPRPQEVPPSGGSLGIAAEYQEPWFYLGGGLRFAGWAAPSGGLNRLDVTPFVGRRRAALAGRPGR